MWFTYVLYSKQLDKFYIGCTEDLERRLAEHKHDHTWTTSRMPGVKIVYYEACTSKKDALGREKALKTGFGRQYLRKRLHNSITQT